MNKIKCTNSSIYNLTVDKEYDIIHESSNFYTIENDEGNTFKYSKRLFEVISEVPATPPPFSCTVIYDEDSFYRITTSNPDNTFITSLYINNTSISCGVYQINNINGVYYDVCNRYNNNEEIDLVIKSILDCLVRSHNAFRFALFSTNITDNRSCVQYFDRILGPHQHEGNNPNSGNDIALWVVDRDNLFI